MTHAIFQNDQESKTATLCSFSVKLFAPKVLLKVFTWKTLSAVSISKLRCRMGCGSISSGDPCAITNYCMNSYLVLQVATAWARELASRFAFQEADWLRMCWDWLVLASDWLRDARVFLSCIGRVIAHNSLVCLNVSSCGGRGGQTWKV